jgi:hypothetical protein
MKNIMIIISLLLTILSKANKVDLVIIDSITNAPIEYVNVGVVGKNFGTISSEQGQIELIIPDSKKRDLLTVSHISYDKKVFSITDLLNHKTTICLNRKDFEIEEVEVVARNLVEKELGSNSEMSILTYRGKGICCEIAVLIPVDNKHTLIEEVGIKLKKCGRKNLQLRVNLYSVDSIGNVGNSMLQKPIYYLHQTENTNPILIDLKRYKIRTKEDFYLSFELFHKDIELTLYGTVFGDKSLFRHNRWGKWCSSPLFTPSIYTKVRTESSSWWFW